MKNRRHMEHLAKVFRRASVLVIALLITSCGIPNWFYLEDSTANYAFKTVQTDKFSDLSMQLTFTAQANATLARIISGSVSPSIMLFYCIDDQPSISTFSSNLISAFTTNYKRTGAGVQLPKPGNGPLVTYSASSSSDQAPYRLYQFQYQGNIAGAPGYMINQEDVGQTKNDMSATLVAGTADTTQSTRPVTLYNLMATQDDTTKLHTLLRYNGKPFYYTNSAISQHDPTAYENDYNQVATTATDMYLHIFAAFNATPESGDNFNNVFWSRLNYLGWIQLNPQTP